jgi:hypothetical protein
MWTCLITLGLWMLIDPMRIGIAALLTSRRQALRSLLAYWLGGIVAGVAVGIVVLVLLHDVALGAIKGAVSALNQLRSSVTILEGSHLHITLGVLALLTLAVMKARERARVAVPVTVPVPVTVGAGDGPADAAVPPRKSSLSSRLWTVIQGMLEGGFMWPAFIAGLGSSVPPIEGPIALTVIMASRAAPGIQLIAFVVFILLVLVFVEVPLICYLAAPQRTHAITLQMHTWIQGHRREIVQTLLAVMGVVSLAQGMAGV